MKTFKQFVTEVKRDDHRAMKLGEYLTKRHAKASWPTWRGMDGPAIKFRGAQHHHELPDGIGDKQYRKQHTHPSGMSHEYWRDLPTSKVRVKDLRSTQEDTAFSRGRATAKFADKEPIRVVKHNGNHYIWDGHHRYMAARLRGHEHIDAKVSDLDAD